MVSYYDNIDVLPIFNWDKYIKSENNNWLIRGFDGRQPIIRNDELIQIAKEIIDQYFIELDDRTIYSRLQKRAKIENLITKYNIITYLLNRCKQGFVTLKTKKEFHAQLASLGFKIKLDTPAELDEMTNMTGSIITQIKMIEDELKEPKGAKPKSLMLQLKTIEKTMGFTVALNPKKITVKEYIELCKELENGNK